MKIEKKCNLYNNTFNYFRRSGGKQAFVSRNKLAFGSKAVVQQPISSESNKAFGSILCVREKFRRSGARQLFAEQGKE